MDPIFNTLVTELPNFGVALLMLYWQRQTINSLLDNQGKLINQLMIYVDRDKVVQAAAMRAAAT